MNKYALITIDCKNNIELVETDSYKVSLQNLYDSTDCDTIQIVRTHNDNFPSDMLMCLDDNGKIVRKPVNMLATYLYGQFPTDFIVGKVTLGTDVSPNPYDEPDLFAYPYEVAITLANMLKEMAN